MRSIIYCLLFLTCVGLNMGIAQSTYAIEGEVRDENNQPVPFANAAVYSEKDSSLVTGNASNEQGTFTVDIAPGSYYIMITFLSYEEEIVSNVQVVDRNVSIGKVVLKPGSKVLESVTVEGEASQMELHLDKRVFQVEKDLVNISGTAADILDNIPSVAVDVEGNVSLRGSQNVRILIDGRPSGLTGISPADALRQLQGNLIERVEVITNPSARYDAEGEVGIINIILKKEKQKGVNGTFTLTGGYPDNLGASLSINFRRKNLNYFVSYGIGYRSNPGRGKSFQSFATEDDYLSYRQNVDRNRSDVSHNFMGGMDLYLTEKSILTGSFLLRKSESTNKTTNNYFDYDRDNELTGNVIRKEHEVEPETNSEVSLSYRQEFDKKDQLLTADFKFIDNQETERASYNQTDVLNALSRNERSINTEDERNILLQADYVHPISGKGKFEAGLKGTQRIIDNDFKIDSLAENGQWNTIPAYNNHLIYTENIYAAYFIAGKEFERISLQAGVRGELSDIKAEMERPSAVAKQDYFNVFPSAHLSYRFNQKRTVQLSYSYRISRPRFRDLMPFSNYSDNRSIMIGNPALRPEYTHSTELGYLLNWSSGSLLSSVYYRYRTGVVERIPLVDSAGFTRNFPINLSHEDSYGVELNLTFDPAKWWRLTSNTNLFRAITEGQYQDQDFHSDTYTWTNRTTSNLTVAKKFDFQVAYNYRAPRQTTQGRDRSMYFVDLGLSRDIFKGNGTVTFAVRDVFNSRIFRSVIVRPDEGFYSEREFQFRKRQFLLTLTYRLNRKKEARNRDGMDEGGGGGED